MMNTIYTKLLFLELLFLQSDSTTHWFINNEGKIQAQMDSMYQLRRPYDFLALIQQEERSKQVEQLKRELIEQKAHIDKNEDKDTQLEERIYRTYSDCIIAGKPLTEFDLYSSNVLGLNLIGIDSRDYLTLDLSNVDSYDEPDCTALELPFSMFALEHLKGLRLKSNLSSLPEDDLASLNDEPDVDKWGHQVSIAMKMNSTSWVLYSLATQFWRAKGDALQAIECVRRAIYLSKREYRHIPLFHLGSILHRGRQSEDAAIVLHMALDHYKRAATVHHLLGCVYATVGYYNESVTCLENALHIIGKDDELIKLKHAVLCHAHLESALEKQLQSLQHTLSELRAYQKKHDEWLNLQQKLLLEQATPEMKLEARLEYEEQKIRESADGRGQDCFQYQQDGHTFLSCNMRRDQLEQQGSSTELLLDLQSLLHTVESETMRLGQQVLKRKPSLTSSVPFVTPLVPSTKNERPKSPIRENSALRLDGENIPLPNNCEDPLSPIPKWNSFPSVWFPFEDKGIELESYISGLEIDYELDFNSGCAAYEEEIADIDNVPGIVGRLDTFQHNQDSDKQINSYLNKYGFSIDQSETELKIVTLLQEDWQPKWVFLNLAGLFWMAKQNSLKSIECLRKAFVEAPTIMKDVALVNLASTLFNVGEIDGSLTLALKAYKINDKQVATNFLLANLYFARGNLARATLYYEKVLAASPDHTQARQFLTAVSCHARHSSSTCKIEGDSVDESCTTVIHDDESVFNTDDKLSEEFLSEIQPGTTNKEILIKIGDVQDTVSSSTSDAPIEDDVLPDVLLRVREKVLFPSMPHHVCEKANHYSDIKHFTSTWLSVSAKNIDISEYLVPTPKEGTQLEEPICSPDFAASMHTMDHLSGVKHRNRLPHHPELGLKEAFQTLTDSTTQPMDLVATRIARSLKKNETSWVIATAAALYWRVMGNGQRAIDCLRHALHNSPRNMKDIPLISMANIFHRSDLLNAALIVGNMALEISPNFVVIHFTMANIYAAKGDYEKAISFYHLTLSLQSTFEPAKERLRILQCSLSNNPKQ